MTKLESHLCNRLIQNILYRVNKSPLYDIAYSDTDNYTASVNFMYASLNQPLPRFHSPHEA